MSSQLDPVGELESLKTHVDHSSSHDFSTPGQRHQSGEAPKFSPTGSPRKENEHHGDHSHHKKSLFSKMKDKAKKLQHSLSNKKKHDEEGESPISQFGRCEDNKVREANCHTTQSLGDNSKDHIIKEVGQEEEDPEYLGAPMYESKKAPKELKEAARQHPREDLVITEMNLLSVLPAKQKYCNIESPMFSEENVSSNVKQENTGDYGATLVTKSVAEKTEAKYAKQEPTSPSKTITETMTEKLAPAYAKVSDATQAITKKIQDIAFPESKEPEAEINDVSEINTAGTSQPIGLNAKVWDKGVSMKEYIAQKFEPGEDDIALSRVISEAISPRKASSHDATFYGATTTIVPAPNSADNKSLPSPNMNEVVEAKNHEKVLQPN